MPLPLQQVQEQVDRAGEAEIIRMLAAVLLWDWPPLVIPSPKAEAQSLMNDILFSKDDNRTGARERARRFLHKLSDQGAARGGF